MNDLLVIEKIQPLTLFTESGELDKILEDIKEKALAHVPDLETAGSRKEVASIAYKVSQSKILLDSAGKKLVKDWKDKAKKVDAARKTSRDFLDNLRDEVRQPLTDWENDEKERIEKEEKQKKFLADWDEALAEHDLFLRQKAIEEKEAKLAAEEEERAAAALKLKEEQEAKDRDERLKKEAAATAKKEAEAAAEKEKLEAEEKAAKEKQAVELKLKEEKEAREKAERDKVAAEERAKIEKELAVKQAKEDTERAAREEKEAAEKLEVEKAAAEKKKADNKAHQKKINNAILKAFAGEGISENVAKEVVILVACNKIPGMIIQY